MTVPGRPVPVAGILAHDGRPPLFKKLFFTSLPKPGERVNVSGDNKARYYAVVETIQEAARPTEITFRIQKAEHYDILKEYGWAGDVVVPLRA